jgi:hypothetical protein
MKRNILYIVLGLVLALMTSSCMEVSADGVLADDLPSGEVRLTDVGNPEEEDLMKMQTYRNPEFEVEVLYPASWDLKETGTEAADFSSDKGESVAATFVWLRQGESFESFLLDVRDGTADLVEIEKTPFDQTLCAQNGETDDEMVLIECYHYHEFEKGTFVVSVGGFILPDSLGVKASPYGLKGVDYKKLAQIAADLPRGEIVTFDKPSTDGSTYEVPVYEKPIVTKPVGIVPIVKPKPIKPVYVPIRVIGQD